MARFQPTEDAFLARARELRTAGHAAALRVGGVAAEALEPKMRDGALCALLRRVPVQHGGSGGEGASAGGVLAEPLREILASAAVGEADKRAREAAHEPAAQAPARIVSMPASTRVRAALSPSVQPEQWSRSLVLSAAAEDADIAKVLLRAGSAAAPTQRGQRALRDAGTTLELPMLLSGLMGAPNKSACQLVLRSTFDQPIFSRGLDALRGAMAALAPAQLVGEDSHGERAQRTAELRARMMAPAPAEPPDTVTTSVLLAPTDGTVLLLGSHGGAAQRVCCALGEACLEIPVIIDNAKFGDGDNAVGGGGGLWERASQMFILMGCTEARIAAHSDVSESSIALRTLLAAAERYSRIAVAADGASGAIGEDAQESVRSMTRCACRRHGGPVDMLSRAYFDVPRVEIGLHEQCERDSLVDAVGVSRQTGADVTSAAMELAASSAERSSDIVTAGSASIAGDVGHRPLFEMPLVAPAAGATEGDCGATSAEAAYEALLAHAIDSGTDGAGGLALPTETPAQMMAPLVAITGSVQFEDVHRLVLDGDLAPAFAMLPPLATAPPCLPPPSERRGLVCAATLAARLSFATGQLGAAATLYLDWHLSSQTGTCSSEVCFRVKQRVYEIVDAPIPPGGSAACGGKWLNGDAVERAAASTVQLAGARAKRVLAALRGDALEHTTVCASRALQCARDALLSHAVDATAAAVGAVGEGGTTLTTTRTETSTSPRAVCGAQPKSPYRRQECLVPLSDLQSSIIQAMHRDYRALLVANGGAVASMCESTGCAGAAIFNFDEQVDSQVAAAARGGGVKQDMYALWLLRQGARHCAQHGISVAHLFMQHALFSAGQGAPDLSERMLRETYAALAAAYEAVETREAVDHTKIALLQEHILARSGERHLHQRQGACLVVMQQISAAAALVPALSAAGLHPHVLRRVLASAGAVEDVHIALNEGIDCLLCPGSDVARTPSFPFQRFDTLVELDGASALASNETVMEHVRTAGLAHYVLVTDLTSVVADFSSAIALAVVPSAPQTGMHLSAAAVPAAPPAQDPHITPPPRQYEQRQQQPQQPPATQRPPPPAELVASDPTVAAASVPAIAGHWPVVANELSRSVGASAATPLPSRRATYSALVSMDEAGEIQLVEREIQLAYDVAMAPDACAVILDGGQLQGLLAVAAEEVPDPRAARELEDTVVDILLELVLLPLTAAFEGVHVIIEGSPPIGWPVDVDVPLALAGSAVGTTAVVHSTCGQTETGQLLKRLIGVHSHAASASLRGELSEIAHAKETELLGFACLNPLSANAVLRTGLSLDTLLSLPASHQQRQTGLGACVLRALAEAYAPLAAVHAEAERGRKKQAERARREEQERRLRASHSSQEDVALDEALRDLHRQRAAAAASAAKAPGAPSQAHPAGAFRQATAGEDLAGLGLMEDYGRLGGHRTPPAATELLHNSRLDSRARSSPATAFGRAGSLGTEADDLLLGDEDDELMRSPPAQVARHTELLPDNRGLGGEDDVLGSGFCEPWDPRVPHIAPETRHERWRPHNALMGDVSLLDDLPFARDDVFAGRRTPVPGDLGWRESRDDNAAFGWPPHPQHSPMPSALNGLRQSHEPSAVPELEPMRTRDSGSQRFSGFTPTAGGAGAWHESAIDVMLDEDEEDFLTPLPGEETNGLEQRQLADGIMYEPRAGLREQSHATAMAYPRQHNAPLEDAGPPRRHRFHVGDHSHTVSGTPSSTWPLTPAAAHALDQSHYAQDDDVAGADPMLETWLAACPALDRRSPLQQRGLSALGVSGRATKRRSSGGGRRRRQGRGDNGGGKHKAGGVAPPRNIPLARQQRPAVRGGMRAPIVLPA